MFNYTNQAIKEQAFKELRKSGQTFIICPSCKKGLYGGIHYICCDNNECWLYDSFKLDNCRICGESRRICSC
jgi:hypothetical protein